jgi:hypothetical protein
VSRDELVSRDENNITVADIIKLYIHAELNVGLVLVD